MLVRPYGREEGLGYGEADGSVSGSKLSGTLRCVNHPHRRSDGTMLPDVHGVIVADDGALVMFSLQGRTFFEHDTGKQVLTTICPRCATMLLTQVSEHPLADAIVQGAQAKGLALVDVTAFTAIAGTVSAQPLVDVGFLQYV